MADTETHVPMDWYGPVRNASDAGKSITWANGRGVGPWKSRLLWAPNGTHLTAQCQSLDFPMPLTLVVNLPASKALYTYLRGCINHRSINSYYCVVAGLCSLSTLTLMYMKKLYSHVNIPSITIQLPAADTCSTQSHILIIWESL
jgi:hypothetical protein